MRKPGVTARGVILPLALMALAACSPDGHKPTQAKAPSPAPAKLSGEASPAAKTADAGHTPAPVRHIAGEGLFHGYMCAWDCSTHQAGYAWASVHRVENPKKCRGPSQAFIEGCWAFTGQDGPFGQREIFQDED